MVIYHLLVAMVVHISLRLNRGGEIVNSLRVATLLDFVKGVLTCGVP
nr:hypothetical protein [Providencia sp. PROV174]